VLVVWVVISSPYFAVCLSNSMVASNVLYYYVNCDRIIVNHIYVMPSRTLPPIILCLTWTSVHVGSYIRQNRHFAAQAYTTLLTSFKELSSLWSSSGTPADYFQVSNPRTQVHLLPIHDTLYKEIK